MLGKNTTLVGNVVLDVLTAEHRNAEDSVPYGMLDKLQFIDLQIRLTIQFVGAIILSLFPILRRTGKGGKLQRLRFAIGTEGGGRSAAKGEDMPLLPLGPV